MKPPDDQTYGADAYDSAVRGKSETEPLFGDERWVDERLRALQASPDKRTGG